MSENNVEKLSDRKIGIIAGSLFALVVGVALLFIKITLVYGDSFTVLAWRFNFAAVGAIVFIIFSKANRKNLIAFDRDAIITTITYIGFMLLQTSGLFFATSIEASIMFAIVPIISKVISNFVLHEKGSIAQNILMVISVIALIYMILEQGTSEGGTKPIGLILLLASSFSVATCNVWMRKVREKRKPFQITFQIIIWGVILINISCGIVTGFDGYFTPLMHWEFVLSSIYLGICSVLISSLLMGLSLSKLSAVEGTIFGNLSTVISIALGAIVLGEAFGISLFISSTIVVGTVVAISILGGREEKEDEI